MTDHHPGLVLASASPRRRELLGRFGLPFRVLATDAEEEEHAPPAVVAQLPAAPVPLHDHPTLRAWRKANAACAQALDSVIIAADTIVVLDDQVLNKPLDAADAFAMLRKLAGRTHMVYTGLAVLNPEDRPSYPRLQLDLVASAVTMADLTDTEISDYVATGGPLDKAGAYGVQDMGGRLVQAVSGSFTSVVGMPVTDLYRLLSNAGIEGLADPGDVYRSWLSDMGKEPLPCPPTFP
jgi:septum formation protein